MDKLYESVAFNASKLVTRSYSSSFSLAILLLDKRLRAPIYGIYGFVRLADEIVDSYTGDNKRELLARYKTDTLTAIREKVSLNPVLHAFQKVVHEYNIELKLIHEFISSMEMDLDLSAHNTNTYAEYIYGSAEVVGLMCLKIFVNGDDRHYRQVKGAAQSLGAAFQKVNFLRDMKDDYVNRGRTYFPEVDLSKFDTPMLEKICMDIENDFTNAYQGIIALPKESRIGVFTAYACYRRLFNKIRKMNATEIKNARVSISNPSKLIIAVRSYFIMQSV